MVMTTSSLNQLSPTKNKRRSRKADLNLSQPKLEVINLCSFNARSMRNKMTEISYFVNNHSINVFAVSESWLGPMVPDGHLQLEGFQLPYRKDRNASAHGGGVCILVSDDLPCRRRTDLELPELELIWIEVFLKCFPVLIGCCYRPPGASNDFYTLLEKSLEKVLQKNIILVGDFNAKHADWLETDSSDQAGRTLKDLTDSINLTQLCSFPTHLGPDGKPSSLLDLVFTNLPINLCRCNVLDPISSSDHLPVVLNTALRTYSKGKTCAHTPNERMIWNYRDKDREKMLSAFKASDWEWLHDRDEADINSIWNCWKKQFFQELNEFVPKVALPEKQRAASPLWLSYPLKRLIVAKNRLYRRAVRTQLPEHWKAYCTVRNRCNNAIKSAKRRYNHRLANKLANPESKASTWWQIARTICGFGQRNNSDIPPLLSRDGDFIIEDREKAELLNDVYIDQNTSLLAADGSFPFGPTSVQSKFAFRNVSAGDVKKAINSLPCKHSAGHDGISYKLIKEAGPGIILPLTTLYNRSLELREVPLEWKTAIVHPIFKGGRKDRTQPSSYRPISLTSCVARLFEKMLNKQLQKYLLDHDLLYQHQSGFLPGHSTITQLAFLTHKWQMALDRGEHVQTAFLDLSKAYDRVSTAGLLFKLSNAGVSPSALEWFTSFLTDRTQCVKVNGQMSTWRTPKSGIPQGTVLGPTLFLLYINDLPEKLEETASIFADDTTVYASGKNSSEISAHLSTDLTSASTWAQNWGMQFAAEKSSHLTILAKQQQRSLVKVEVKMDGVTIPAVKRHKHLGVTIDENLTWQDHINSIHTTCARQIGLLARLRNVLSKPAVRRIFTGFIRPRLEYASAIWSGGNITKLLKLQEKFCKRHRLTLPALNTRLEYHTLLLFFKIRQNTTPSYLSAILPRTFNDSTTYRLRKMNYPFPGVRKTSSLNGFFPRAIEMWNNLPVQIQQSNSLQLFKRNLRAHLQLAD